MFLFSQSSPIGETSSSLPAYNSSYTETVDDHYPLRSLQDKVKIFSTPLNMKELSASGAANLGASISMLVLSVVAVALRLLFRLNARQSITLSDAFIGLALLFSIIDYALLISCRFCPSTTISSGSTFDQY